MKTVVSYIHGTFCTYSMKVFNFKIDTVDRWNVMMNQLMEAHPEAKKSIIIIFMKELND